MVALYHFPIGGRKDTNGLISNSRMIVGFFFVLSGFVIAANYAERLNDLGQIGRFTWLRIGRLYPLHFAILMAFVAYECAKLGIALFQSGSSGDAFMAPNEIVALGFLTCVVGISFVTSRLIEVPCRDAACRMLKKREAPVIAAPIDRRVSGPVDRRVQT